MFYSEVVPIPAADRIVSAPGVCGGMPRIAGQPWRVSDVAVWSEHLGMTPYEIVSRFPSLTLADVHYALAWYFDHIEEIRSEIEKDRALAEKFCEDDPSLVVTPGT
jgi:uncharacterized protein (DUF433 family)